MSSPSIPMLPRRGVRYREEMSISAEIRLRITEERRNARREQIIDAARSCVQEHGLEAVTMEMIIARSGLSTGAVYRYFKGRRPAGRPKRDRSVRHIDHSGFRRATRSGRERRPGSARRRPESHHPERIGVRTTGIEQTVNG